MGTDVQFELKGFDELERRLETAPFQVTQQALRNGLEAGAEIWRQGLAERVRRGWHHWRKGRRGTRHSLGTEPVSRAPVFGYLHEHEAMRVTVQSDEVAGIARVGPAKAGFWARFLEFGVPGRGVPAYPFMRPTFEASRTAVIEAFGSAVRASLAKFRT